MSYNNTVTDSIPKYFSSSEKMKYEKFRIESFRNWPIPYIDCRELAAQGFYYINESDIVKCSFCDIHLSCWEAEDTGVNQHLKWAPYCPMVRGRGNEYGNIKLNSCIKTRDLVG